MRTSTAMTLSQAAKATGKSRSAVLRAIQKGRISAEKDENGEYAIEPAELFRHYERAPERAPHSAPVNGTPHTSEVNSLHQRLEAANEERERERAQLQDTIADLRRRLDASEEERRRTADQLRLLTDQRQQGQTDATKEVAALRDDLDALRRRGFWAWMFSGNK